MSSSSRDFDNKPDSAKTSAIGIFKDEQKISSETLPNEVGTLLTDIFNKNVDRGKQSALQVSAVNVNIKDGNPEWKFDYSTRMVRKYGDPSPGSSGRKIFIEALKKTKAESKMDVEIVDRSHITVRDKHVKFLECLKDTLPKIYEEFINKMRSQQGKLVKEQELMTEKCQSLIDRLPSYLDSVKQKPPSSTI